MPQGRAEVVLVEDLVLRLPHCGIAACLPQERDEGRHLVARGLKPGKDFKRILDAAFEAQLEGAFADEAAGRVWLDTYLVKLR
jgi:tRNA nucleotidyltransferase (CCA-adding enzyme)